MNRFTHCGQTIILIFLLSGCGTSLQEYNPKNENEKDIKNLLVQFSEYRNSYDVKNIASCLSDNCIINYYGRNLTKKSFVSRMKRGDLESRGKFKYTNPKFKIVDENAKVIIDFRQGITSFSVNFILVKENSVWKITEWSENFH